MAEATPLVVQSSIKPFLILGSPRSGSSLLRALLNTHTQIVVPPECGYIKWLGKKFKGAPVDIEEFVAALSASKKIEGWGLDFDVLKAKLKQQFGNDRVAFEQLVDFTHRSYGGEKQVVCWGDKNNYYIDTPTEVLDIIGFRIIHLIRDPRGCYASRENLQTDYKSQYAPDLTRDLSDFCDEWKTQNEGVLALKETTPFIRVRYEDLLSNPAKEMGALFEWIGVESEETFHSFYLNVDEPAITLEWKQRLASPMDAGRATAWKGTLTASVQEDIWNALGSDLISWGYEK